jgi:Protein of unknown function (DUF4238)
MGTRRGMSKEGKHHYIPVFYLKQWTGSDGRLCEFSRPHDCVKPRRVHPDGTGYVHGLYRVPGLPYDEAQYVEREYLKKLDDKASIALRAMIAEVPLNKTLNIAWACFLYSLILRTPESLVRLGEQFEKTKSELVKKTNATLSPNLVWTPGHLPNFLASKLVIPGIVRMRWSTISVANAKHSLLTSDRPVIMTNGLAQPTNHIAMPLSPTKLFVATNSDETLRQIRSMPADRTVEAVNTKVCEQAVKFIYGTDDCQLRFAANRLGKRVRSTPLG